MRMVQTKQQSNPPRATPVYRKLLLAAIVCLVVYGFFESLLLSRSTFQVLDVIEYLEMPTAPSADSSVFTEPNAATAPSEEEGGGQWHEENFESVNNNINRITITNRVKDETVIVLPDSTKNDTVAANDELPQDETVKLPTPSDVNDQLQQDGSFSACILWMDDNHRLDEWLAYHYYLLKLRYVVLNIDPFSRTSPQPIIDRWNDKENKHNLNMTIVTTKDSDYIRNYDKEMQKIEKARIKSMEHTQESLHKYGQTKLNYHTMRQEEFYRSCSKHLMGQNRSWTSYHDTDEFLTFNHVANKQNITAESMLKMEQPGYVLHRLNTIKTQNPRDSYANDTGLSCLVVSRRRFCAVELESEETNGLFVSSSNHSSSTIDGIVPEGFMNSSIESSTEEERISVVRRFDTLRYKFLTPGYDGMPKSFIDLSQNNPKLYIQDKYGGKGMSKWGTHMPMHTLCITESKARLDNTKKLVKGERFFLSHYLGSWEYYSYRNDARQGGLRTYTIWQNRAIETKGEISYVIRPWLRGFVDLVGGPSVAS
mmetsp:Transcript_37745/g.42252  ORF Transcript_37745/g.42252 Transcript_37745/m.42252 type:complete len:538 (-) Transcript_37745:134-1747(-)